MANNNTTAAVFDRKKAWESKCKPLLDSFAEACRSCGIPYFATACVKDNGKSSEYAVEAYPPDLDGIRLADDRIVKHIRVHRGYDVRMPGTDIVLNMGDVDGFDEVGELFFS